MARDAGHRSDRPRDGVGDAALTCGVVAMVFVFFPIVGEFVALPAAVVAMVLCLVSVVREGRGVGVFSGKALVGGLLGLISAFITVMLFAATGTLE